MSKRNSFKKAFTEARASGQSMFYWNDKLYNTRKSNETEAEFRWKNPDYDAYLGNVGTFEQSPNSPKDSQGNPFFWGNWGKVKQQNYEPSTIYTGPTEVPEKNTYRRFDRFSRDDIKSLSFNNYTGLVNAAVNPQNKNNPFIRALIGRFGDPTKWDQNYVEKSLGVGGKYRSFNFGGDYGKMETALNTFIGGQNGRIDYYNGTQEKFNDPQNETLSDYLVRLEKEGQRYNNPLNKSNPLFTEGNMSNAPVRKTFLSKEQMAQGNPQQVADNTLPNDWRNRFNTNLKLQQGGKMNEKELQQQFMQYLAQKSGAKSQKELEQVIQQLGEEGLKKEYAEFMKAVQEHQVRRAQFGAKLNYLNYLRGNCPKGYEMRYFRQGGKLCKKCEKKMEQQRANRGNTVNEFKKSYR